MKILLNHQVPIDTQTNGRKETALHLAIYNGHREVACYLINRGADYFCVDLSGRTPFHVAIIRGLTKVVEDILALDETAIHRKTQDNLTPLKLACSSGNVEVVQLLLDNGAIRNNMLSEAADALELARSNGFNEIVCLLVDSGYLDEQLVG